MPITERVEKLSLPSYRFYGFLCREMNARSACQLAYSNAEIAEHTRIKDPKTIDKARRELQSVRLIECRQVPPGVYLHVMLDQVGDPIPPPPDRKGIRHYSALTTKKAWKPRINPVQQQDLSVSIPPTTEATAARRCHTHGLVSHWKRGGDWLCESCHLNPHLEGHSNPPTAAEIGFK